MSYFPPDLHLPNSVPSMFVLVCQCNVSLLYDCWSDKWCTFAFNAQKHEHISRDLYIKVCIFSSFAHSTLLNVSCYGGTPSSLAFDTEHIPVLYWCAFPHSNSKHLYVAWVAAATHTTCSLRWMFSAAHSLFSQTTQSCHLNSKCSSYDRYPYQLLKNCMLIR